MPTPRKKKTPTEREFLTALADALDRMTALDIVRFVSALRRRARATARRGSAKP